MKFLFLFISMDYMSDTAAVRSAAAAESTALELTE
jgi:hypothetical protein